MCSLVADGKSLARNAFLPQFELGIKCGHGLLR